MKDLGKKKSPIQDKNVLEMFDKTLNDGHSGDARATGDSEQNLTDKVMDHHLSDLEGDIINKTSTICDIAQYMANLKEKHMQSEIHLIESNLDQKRSYLQSNGDVKHMDTDQESSSVSFDEPCNRSQQMTQSSEDESSLIVIDKRVDKVFRGEKAERAEKNPELMPKCILKSPRQSIQMSHSPDRIKSMGNSPVKIIKVKTSPRGSVDSKRHSVSLSRDNSRERYNDSNLASQYGSHLRRASDGGILKNMLLSSPLEPSMFTGGILKRSCSPMSKSKSPDRKAGTSLRKTLSPCTSFDSRSSDRTQISPHSSFDARSPDRRSNDSCYSDRGYPKGNMQLRSNQSSFDSRSPDRDSHRRSLSAHSSFIKSKSPEAYYQYCYPYDYQRQVLPERKGKRVSKSLERSSSQSSSNAYRYNLSPENIYHIGNVPSRSHSAEYAIIKHDYNVSRSNDSLTRSIEQPTCVECLYQRKPS